MGTSRKHVKITNEYIKRCSTSFIVRNKHIKFRTDTIRSSIKNWNNHMPALFGWEYKRVRLCRTPGQLFVDVVSSTAPHTRPRASRLPAARHRVLRGRWSHSGFRGDKGDGLRAARHSLRWGTYTPASSRDSRHEGQHIPNRF